MAWSFVSPASRGIGFALAKQLLRTTTIPVVATARTDTAGVKRSLLADLHDIDPDRLTVLELDVTDEASIAAAAATAKSLFPPQTSHLRLSLNVPGILHAEKAPHQIDSAQALATFRVNTLGPLLVLKHFSPFLPRKATAMRREAGLAPHAVWAIMSARVGSTSDNALGGWYSYRASKAGVNSLVKTFDLFLRGVAGDQAVALALHPGTVRTGLSRDFWASVEPGKLFTPEFAAESLLGVVRRLEVERGRGRCWDWKGEEILP